MNSPRLLLLRIKEIRTQEVNGKRKKERRKSKKKRKRKTI